MASKFEDCVSQKDKVLFAHKMAALDILIEFDRICRKNNIDYTLSGGTMLGSVRHKGFIPWDDDIDVEMYQKDFEKFIVAVERDADPDKFVLEHIDNVPERPQTFASFGMKNTELSTQAMAKKGFHSPLSIDIFILDYMPNDEKKRAKLTTKLYMLRVWMYYKQFGTSFHRIPAKKQKLVSLILKIMPLSLLKRIYKHYKFKYRERTDWILDCSIVHGNYGGYKREIRDEVIESEFEGHKFFIPRRYDEELTILYDENYMEYPPVDQRYTAHRWGKVDLGEYAKKYNLPDDYPKYLLMEINEDRLKVVKQLVFDMIQEVDRICKKHDIKYYLTGRDALYKEYDLEEYSKYWRSFMTISMDQKNLKKFEAVLDIELDSKYFYQSVETEDHYKFFHPRIRLNDTVFRDNLIIGRIMNHGVYLDIDVLVNTSNNLEERKKHMEDIKKFNEDLRVVWLFFGLKEFWLRAKMFRRRWLFLRYGSVNNFIKARDKVMNRYENEDTDYYQSTFSFDDTMGLNLRKEYYAEGTRLKYANRSFIFPSKLKAWTEDVLNSNKKFKLLLLDIIGLKKNNPVQYSKDTESLSDKEIVRIQNAIPFFNLKAYDHPEYRVTMPEEVEQFKKEKNCKKK